METKVCPCCGKEILAKAVKCKFCHAAISNTTPGRQSTELKTNTELPAENTVGGCCPVHQQPGKEKKRRKVIIAAAAFFLIISLAAIGLFWDSITPTQNNQGNQSNNNTTYQPGNPDPDPVESGDNSDSDQNHVLETLTDDEVIDLLHNAEKVALKFMDEGFQAEMNYSVKRPFSIVSGELQSYYSEEIIDKYENLYDSHLMEWGFEMGILFPLHDYDRACESLSTITHEEQTIISEFIIDYGPANDALFKTYTINFNGSGWVIVDINSR